MKDSINESELQVLRARIKSTPVMKFIEGYRGFQVVFELRDIEPAMYVRTIQEVEMLKTRCWT